MNLFSVYKYLGTKSKQITVEKLTEKRQKHNRRTKKVG